MGSSEAPSPLQSILATPTTTSNEFEWLKQSGHLFRKAWGEL